MIRYYVTDRRQADVLACTARAVREGIDMIQVREKDLPASELFDFVCKIRDLAAGSTTRVLVNDRLDIALAAGVDGVHLPANGLPAERVRPLIKMLGVSTHTVKEAIAAEKSGADFIVFGPIFDSPGKSAVGLEPLRKVAGSVKIPVLAIGGITAANTNEVLNAGAAGIAGIRLFQSALAG
jgi:thiamine-phosphate pyrophosphorylase